MATKKSHDEKSKHINNKFRFFIYAILIVGLVLRVVNLNWGAPYYFHPDERNIAGVLDQNPTLSIHALTQSTFSYGNFPILLILFVKLLLAPLQVIPFFAGFLNNSFLLLRFESFIFSVGILILCFIIGKLFSKYAGILFLTLAAFSPGLIQQAHFGTFDTFVTFWAVLSFYFLIQFVKKKKMRFFFFSLIAVSIGAAAKINLLIIASIPIIYFLYIHRKKNLLKAFLVSVLSGATTIIFSFLLSPYYFTAQFWGLFAYERKVVTGSLPVFYTESFSKTIPFLFPTLHIYPFLINPLLTLLLIPCLFFLIYLCLKSRNIMILLLLLYFFILFLPNSMLFTKWTRYLIPTLPFIYFAFTLTLIHFLKSFKFSQKILALILGIIITFSIIYAVSYTIVAFVYPDTRIAAAQWAAKNIPKTTKILTEPYDLGIMPFQSYFPPITQFDFYSLDDQNPQFSKNELEQVLINTDFILLPSTRVAKTRLRDATDFPQGHKFYSQLFYNKNKFILRYHTPCDLLCKFVYLGDPVNSFEETAYVFDRPTVYIFQKK